MHPHLGDAVFQADDREPHRVALRRDGTQLAPERSLRGHGVDAMRLGFKILRTGGREKAMAVLGSIANAEHLKILAREQQLGIDPELALPDEIRSAIVSAAERRIANRRAAAS